MANINLDLYKDEIDTVTNWIKSEYNEKFSEYFVLIKELYSKFVYKYTPISDDDLERILTIIPLQLHAVTEELANLTLKDAIVKLENKKTQDPDDIFSGQLIAKAYQTLIERVGREISYSKELVMSAKKIWSARKQTETIGVPAESVEIDLPEYDADSDRRL